MERVFAWSTPDGDRFEWSHAVHRLGTLSARGTILAAGETPYRADYQLDTGAGYVAKRLTVQAAGLGWTRTLRLARDAEGGWSIRRTAEDPDDQVSPLDPAELLDATDASVAGCGLTGGLPVLRHRLHRAPGRHVVIAAWVSLPDLTVHRREQTYTHLAAGQVRCATGTYSADVEFDADGFVADHPGVAARVAAREPAASCVPVP